MSDIGKGLSSSAGCLSAQDLDLAFGQHYDQIWSFLYRLAGAEHADDLAGEVFLVALRRRDRFDPGLGTLRSWLFGIALNLSHTRLRGDVRRQRAFARVANATLHHPEEEAATVARVDAVAALEATLAAMAQLPARDREVIQMFVWDHMSYEELAAALRVEIGTVRSRLARARARLRELVDRRGEPIGDAASDKRPNRTASEHHDG